MKSVNVQSIRIRDEVKIKAVTHQMYRHLPKETL